VPIQRTKTIMVLFAVILLCMSTTATSSTNDVVAVVDQRTGHVTLEVGGDAYMKSIDIFTRADGRVFSTTDDSLSWTKTRSGSGQDVFGTWNSTEITWAAGSTPFITTVRQYGSGGGQYGD